ncbi:MAG: ADP-glyceromanno-heptose 6-epimerase [bacterium]|nr:ADP-glyceromanno-heptose 6-epimerase [bacterium]
MIVITGGAGFIGSAFAWKCNLHGRNDIVIVDELGTSEKWKNLVNLDYLDYMHKNDFLERILNNSFNEKVEAVVHMGACSSTSEKDASYLMANNYQYTKNLALWCIDKGIRFIYASSAATYGDGEKGFADEHSSLQRLRSINRYGYSKHLFDLFALKSNMLDKITGLKFFNVYGPNEYHKGEMMSVVNKAYDQIMFTGKLKLFKSYKEGLKDGDQKRDFIYIKDCVDVIYWLLENPQVTGIYNVGSGQARSWNDLARAVFDAIGKEENIEYIEMPESIQAHYQNFTQADMKKIKADGYTGQFLSIEDAVKDYTINYLACSKYLDH